MLTYHRKPITLSLISTDLPVCSLIETAATLYQKDRERFHVVWNEPAIFDRELTTDGSTSVLPTATKPRLLWLEVSPYRVIMTMQGNGKYSYRHLWEPGVYGISRYWLHNDNTPMQGQLQFKNFTRSLQLVGKPIPEYLRLEYELWSGNLEMGRYVLNLEIY